MYYSRQRKMVFLAQPHTGSRSISQALLGMGFIQRAFPGSHHAGLYHDLVVTPNNRKEWFVFSVIRNHFDMLVSRVWKQQDYREGVQWADVGLFQKAIDNALWIRGGEMFGLHKRNSDRLLRYETLADDLADVLGEPVELPEVGKNPVRRGRHYRDFYVPKTRKLVEDRFGDEMRELGYAW